MTTTIQGGTVGTILEILDMLPDDMILSDGGTDWSVECLADAIRDAEESDAREYVVGFAEDGRVTVSEVTEAAIVTPPAYTQVIEG